MYAKTGINMTTVTIEQLRELFPIRSLPERVLRYLIGVAEVEEFSTGHTLFQEGDKGSDGFYLLSGRLRLESSAGKSSELEGGTVGAHFPFFNGGVHKVSAVSLTPIVVLRLSQNLLESVDALKLHDEELGGFGIGLQEGGTESSIYMQFYETMKAGKLELPSLPDLALRIVQAMKDPNITSQDIARIIQLDPSLTARIIGVVNSPAYAGVGRIDDCPAAVTRLGHIATRNLAVSFILKNLFRSNSKLLRSRMIQLWKHSSRVSAICHVLAKFTPGLDPDQAMLRGLIHDIGVIPLLSAAQKYPKLMANPGKLDLIVSKLNGEIGAMLLRNWVFTSDFVDTAMHAEDWMRDVTSGPDYTDLVIVAQLHAYVGTPRMAELPRMDLVPAFHKMALGRLTPEHSISVLDKAKQEIRAIEQLLQSG